MSQAKELPRVGVLDLGIVGRAVSRDDAAYLTDRVRDRAFHHLGHSFIVITRENLVDLVKANGMTLEQCSKAECATEYGRAISADYVITGDVRRFAGELKATLRLHQTSPPAMLGSQTWGGGKVGAIERKIEHATVELLSVLTSGAGQLQKQEGSLFLRVKTPDVYYSIDGTLRSGMLRSDQVEKIKLPLRERPYRVVLQLQGHYEYDADVQLFGDRLTYTIDRRMVPIIETIQIEGEAFLTLRSTPSNAEIRINGDLRKEHTPATLKLSPGRHFVEIARKKYQPWTESIELLPGDTKERSDIRLKKNFGALRIEVIPAEADIFLDGDRVGTGHYEEPQQETRGYTLKVAAKLYRPFEGSIFVERGQDNVERIELQPAFGTLRLRITAPVDSGEDDKPTIFVDGEPFPVEVGAATSEGGLAVTAIARKVPSGSRDIEVQMPRFRTWVKTVDVRDGDDRELAVVLDSTFGTLEVTSDPVGCEVFIDRRVVGKAPLTRTLDEGTHKLEVRGPAEHYRLFDRDVTIRKNAMTSIDARLEVIHGALKIASQPPGAAIYVDGKPVGAAVVDLEKALVGTRRIEARLDEYTPTVKHVVVQEGQAQMVLVELESLGAAGIICNGPEDDRAGVMIILDAREPLKTDRHEFKGLSAGPHTVVCRSPRGHEVKRRFVSAPGQREELVLDLSDPKVLMAAWEEHTGGYEAWGWGLLALSAASGVASGVFFVKAEAAHEDVQDAVDVYLEATQLDDLESLQRDISDAQDERDQFDSFGWISLGIAGASAIGALTSYLLIPDSPFHSARSMGSRGRAPRFVVAPTAEGLEWGFATSW